jgi:hypothetical protein
MTEAMAIALGLEGAEQSGSRIAQVLKYPGRRLPRTASGA